MTSLVFVLLAGLPESKISFIVEELARKQGRSLARIGQSPPHYNQPWTPIFHPVYIKQSAELQLKNDVYFLSCNTISETCELHPLVSPEAILSPFLCRSNRSNLHHVLPLHPILQRGKSVSGQSSDGTIGSRVNHSSNAIEIPEDPLLAPEMAEG